MEQQQWSEWIEWQGGECPIPGVKAGDYSVKWPDGKVSTYKNLLAQQVVGWSGDIAAYRVRLTAQPATTEPDRDIDIGDGVDENARMLERDAAGMRDYVAPVPSFELRIEPEEAPGLLVLAPMERLGATRWGAQS